MGWAGCRTRKRARRSWRRRVFPNFDALAAKGICGLADPIAPGITPGSGPGHLALFGYDPVKCEIGRGALEAMGIDVELKPGDIAARGNFCTIDEKGIITDRRAGRISTEKCAELCKMLDGMKIDGVDIKVIPGQGAPFCGGLPRRRTGRRRYRV